MDTLDCLDYLKSDDGSDMTEIEVIAHSKDALALFKETYKTLSKTDLYAARIEFNACYARVRFEKKIFERELKAALKALAKYENQKGRAFVYAR
jgi:hypothetical protein